MRLFHPLAVLASRTILFAITQSLFAVLFGLSLNESAAWWPITAIIANVISTVLLAKLLRREKIRYRDLILFEKSRIIKDVKLSGLVLIVAGVVGMLGIFGVAYLLYGSGPPDQGMTQPLPVWAALIALVIWPISNVIVETPTYMGYALPRLEVLWKSKSVALAAASLFLALQHFTLPVMSDLKFMMWHFLCMIPLAIAVGVLYVKLRRLLPIMFVHYCLDVLVVYGVFAASMPS